ncbi:hypothetical protein LMG28138_01804 [Pararobbsia alpina]|uniref:Uncharacterized protein n=1 Tax=Pararobbsia alpina TaxID=621374 RepID=A0A6S7B3M9_9BURK|nr:hypothetical protein LMG28138_01804 [Pararobbsia alpina]
MSRVPVEKARAYCKERGLRDPGHAFKSQRNNAKERGIEWDMTFDEWWTIWEPYFHMRGRGTNDLCMARTGDMGSYKVGNVYLTTHLGNARDYHAPRNAEKQRKQEQADRYWGRNDPYAEAKSHRAYKIHCNPVKRVAE